MTNELVTKLEACVCGRVPQSAEKDGQVKCFCGIRFSYNNLNWSQTNNEWNKLRKSHTDPDKIVIKRSELEKLAIEPYRPTGDKYFDRFNDGQVEGFEKAIRAVKALQQKDGQNGSQG